MFGQAVKKETPRVKKYEELSEEGRKQVQEFWAQMVKQGDLPAGTYLRMMARAEISAHEYDNNFVANNDDDLPEQGRTDTDT